MGSLLFIHITGHCTLFKMGSYSGTVEPRATVHIYIFYIILKCDTQKCNVLEFWFGQIFEIRLPSVGVFDLSLGSVQFSALGKSQATIVQ